MIFRVFLYSSVEIWGNEKLKWEHEPTGRVFPCYFEYIDDIL